MEYVITCRRIEYKTAKSKRYVIKNFKTKGLGGRDMFISEIVIDGYKNCKEKSTITFNQGLNILVGENAAGKSTIINAIRLILRDNELPYVSDDDFYKAFDMEEQRKEIQIDIQFKNLNPEEQITFLSWCNHEFDAELHLEVEKNPNPKGYYKKKIWGGKSRASAFEEETFDYIDTIYLPALRDAEEKLTSGKKSRLALLLKHQYGKEERKEELVKAFNSFNDSIIKNDTHQFDEIQKAKGDINTAIINSMGKVFGQSVNLQFSESSFMSILQNIKMVFFPHLGDITPERFRDVAINSLGYNNLLYIATVFAELEVINENRSLFSVLLIEEPEAHLHPQIQSKLIKYLYKLASKKNNIQIILTTHSSVLASSVGIDNIIHISGNGNGITSCKIKDFLIQDNIKNYINRWLDVTKSVLLFSKGVILVEGICESMLLPYLAPIVLKEYNNTHKNKLPNSLEEAGVSIININGINFKYFFPLFCDLEGNGDKRLPIRCSGMTDRDPVPTEIEEETENDEIISELGRKKSKQIEQYPVIENSAKSGNEAVKLVDIINSSTMARFYVSPYKTFEYDLAMAGNCSIMSEVIKIRWPKEGGETGVKATCQKIKDKADKYSNETCRGEDAKYIYKHIESEEIGKGTFCQALVDELNNKQDFKIPNYIKKSIIWACGGECE